MKITVHVKIKSKIQRVEKLSHDSYIVRVNAIPEDGKANKRIIELLAKHFGIPKTQIDLISGAKSKTKIFKLADLF